MTIDINELRRLMQDFKLAGSPMLVQTAQMSELFDRLEAAEKSDAESIAMYRKARDERDALRAENAALVDDMNLLRNNNTALRSKIEAAENDAAHQKALAASALRVAEGWERKCGELRAKIERIDEAMESLLIRCDDSDSAMYGTLSTSFVRDTVRIARGAMEESK